MNPNQYIEPWMVITFLVTAPILVFATLNYFCPCMTEEPAKRWHQAKHMNKFAFIFAMIGMTAFAGVKHYLGGDDPGDSTNDVGITEGDCTNSVPDDVTSPDMTNNPPEIVDFPDASTNTPPDVIDGGDPDPTNPPPMMCGAPRMTTYRDMSQSDAALVSRTTTFRDMSSGLMSMSLPPGQTEPDILCSPSPSTFTSITAWNKRGAYCDWVRVEFQDGFEFPHGTNLLSGVTVMAYGELRSQVEVEGRGGQWNWSPIISLPQEVSLEPDASSVCYGLTSSNTYLFAWTNCCVEREATNRVDASIELFPDGAIAITVTPLSTPTPSTYTYIPARPPEGFCGQGQDDDWIAANWPGQYAAITNKGYGAWLMEDYVGINEQNGRYKVDVTVSQLPQNGPCYLVVGPHRMTVTSPGMYSFPLEVDTDYLARTYPVAVPLSFSYDDGYRYEFPDEYPRLYGAPRLLGAPRNDDNIYHINQSARAVAYPSTIYLGEPFDGSVFIWCNKAGATRDFWSSVGDELRVTFVGMTEAEIDFMTAPAQVTFYWDNPQGHTEATVDIYEFFNTWLDDDDDGTNQTVTVEGTNDVAFVSRALIDSFATRRAQGGRRDLFYQRGETLVKLSDSSELIPDGRCAHVSNLSQHPFGFLVPEKICGSEIDDGIRHVAAIKRLNASFAKLNGVFPAFFRYGSYQRQIPPPYSCEDRPHRHRRHEADHCDAAGLFGDDEELVLGREDFRAALVFGDGGIERGEPVKDVLRSLRHIAICRDGDEGLERGVCLFAEDVHEGRGEAVEV